MAQIGKYGYHRKALFEEIPNLVFPSLYPSQLGQKTQNNDETLAVWNFDLLQIGWFNKFLDPFFEGIVNMSTKMFDCACGTCYIQNSDWGRRSRLGDLPWLISFKVVLDPNLQGILNLKREIWNSHCVSQYSKIGDSGRRSRLDDLLQLISFKIVLDPNLEGKKYLACSLWYSQYDLGPRGGGQVPLSNWFCWTWT